MVSKNDEKDQQSGAPYAITCDWLSFSVATPVGAIDEYNHALEVHTKIRKLFPQLQVGDTARKFSRRPYTDAYDLAVGGLALFAFNQPHATVEITGRGCQELTRREEFIDIALAAIAEAINITRFDLAVDFETDVKPLDFAEQKSARWKAGNIDFSETGETVYVGAKKSDRRAKVYRYYPPHERAHLLRVEMTFSKKGGAYSALDDFLLLPGEEMAARMGNTFGWSHSLWCFDSDQKIKNYRPERGHANTVRWVHLAVIPALERLYGIGVLDDNHPIWSEMAEHLPLDHAPNSTPLRLQGGRNIEPPTQLTLPNTDGD